MVRFCIWRYWDQKYGGLKIYAVTSDVVEFIVTHPPESREAALELAREQYLYCPDIVDQAVQTIARLGATLQNSRYWFFGGINGLKPVHDLAVLA